MNKLRSIFILFYVLFIPFYGNAQIVKGVIKDDKSNKPIFGANIIMNSDIVAISDSNGLFNFNLKSIKNNDSISIAHISYKTRTIGLSDFLNKKSKGDIFLHGKIESLAEVRINSLSSDDVLKKMFQNFKRAYKYDEYLAAIKYDQIIKNKNSIESLLQIDGFIFMPMDKRNPFNMPLLLPEEMRRTKENPEIGKKWYALGKKKNYRYNQLAGLFARTHWTNYGFYEKFNPLKYSQRKNYNYKVLGAKNIGEKKYYIINFQQVEPLSKKGWSIYNTYGQILIDYSNFSIHNITFNFKFDDLSYNSYVIDYIVWDNKLLPEEIKVVNYRFNEDIEDVRNIIIEGQLHFEHYQKEKFAMNFDPIQYWFAKQNHYNAEYWDDRSFLNPDFERSISDWINESQLRKKFEEGYEQGELNDRNKLSNSEIDSFEENVIKFNQKISNYNR
jgi:hypothetical protein